LTVTRSGRGSAGRSIQVEVALPVPAHSDAPTDPTRRQPGSPEAAPLRLVG